MILVLVGRGRSPAFVTGVKSKLRLSLDGDFFSLLVATLLNPFEMTLSLRS